MPSILLQFESSNSGITLVVKADSAVEEIFAVAEEDVKDGTDAFDDGGAEWGNSTKDGEESDNGAEKDGKNEM